MFTLFFLPFSCFAKIYDCFPFFNEIELLQIRLHELSDVVDYFVLVESIETQRGHPKRLFFEENKQEFHPYLHKIIHIIIDEMHPEFGLWERENYQRNAILRGLAQCKKKDLILISDVDEIPRKEFIPYIKKEMERRSAEAIAFQCRLYRYHLNRSPPENYFWDGTVATTYSRIAAKSPQYYRDRRSKFWSFKEAGWHFTWMGGKERYKQKMTSVVEGTDDWMPSDEDVEGLFRTVPIVPLDSSFPAYILEHEQELRALDFIASE